MKVEEIKSEILNYIDNLEEQKLYFIYNQIFGNKSELKFDFWNTLNKHQKEDIEKGISDLDNGKMKKFDDFIQKHL